MEENVQKNVCKVWHIMQTKGAVEITAEDYSR